MRAVFATKSSGCLGSDGTTGTTYCGLGYSSLAPDDPYVAAGVSAALDKPGMSMQEKLSWIASALACADGWDDQWVAPVFTAVRSIEEESDSAPAASPCLRRRQLTTAELTCAYRAT
jgi:hypothetical protein